MSMPLCFARGLSVSFRVFLEFLTGHQVSLHSAVVYFGKHFWVTVMDRMMLGFCEGLWGV